MAPFSRELSASFGHTKAIRTSTPNGTKTVGHNLVLQCFATKLFACQVSVFNLLCSREKRWSSFLWTLHSERTADSATIAVHVLLSYPLTKTKFDYFPDSSNLGTISFLRSKASPVVQSRSSEYTHPLIITCVGRISFHRQS